MTKIEELFNETTKELESMEFTVWLCVVSSSGHFHRVVVSHKTFLILVGIMSAHPDYVGRLYDRAIFLVEKKVDPQYCHPDDATLAIYLLALEATHPGRARAFSETIYERYTLFWARHVALDIITKDSRSREKMKV